MNRAAHVIAIILCALVSTGCDDPMNADTLMTTGESFTFYEPGKTLTGTLSVNAQGCVVLTGEETALFVAPDGSNLTEDGASVEVKGHGTFELGSEISVPGETVPWQKGRPAGARPIGWDTCVKTGELPIFSYVYPS